MDKFETIIDSCSTPILDLGCGSGNDTLYLINKNKQVISCDQSSNAINNIKKNFPEVYDTKCFNMLDGMPFDNNSFELIIADLCLHYFKEKDTFELFEHAVEEVKAKGYLKDGDNTVITAGVPLGTSGTTNMLKVETV